MRLLVTGVSGLLGLNAAYLAGERYDVTGVMRGERAVPAAGPARFHTLLADLTCPGALERIYEKAAPDLVIHCAALTNVDYCETYPEEAYQMNTRLAADLAALTERNGTQLVHISTDSVFDGLRGEYVESDPPNPVNVYARTKLEGERAVADANPDALIARVNFYGWSWQGRRSLSEWFLQNLSAGSPINGFADIIFAPLLANDLVEVLLRMASMRLSGLFHVVSPEAISKYQFGLLLARTFGFDEHLVSPCSYRSVGLKAARSPRLSLHSEKLPAVLGELLPDQETSMRRYLDLYQQGYPQVLRSVFVEPDHSLVA